MLKYYINSQRFFMNRTKWEMHIIEEFLKMKIQFRREVVSYFPQIANFLKSLLT